MTPRRRRFNTRLILNEGCFARLDLQTQRDVPRRAISPEKAELARGVNLRPTRSASLEDVCSICAQLFKTENTFSLLWAAESGNGANAAGPGSDNGAVSSPAQNDTTLRRIHIIPKDDFIGFTRHTCRLCQALWHRFRDDLSSRQTMFESKPGILSFPFSFDQPERTIAFHDLRHSEAKALVFDLVAHRGSKDIFQVIKRQPPESNVGSDRSFQQAKHWLAQCAKRHGEDGNCPKLTWTQLPKRVIDVSGRSPRLRLGKGASGRYACLSYCWGDGMQVVTYSDTLHQYSERITYSSLPRTVQDAIVVTRKLNLRYLWVDCLCIVQDDAAEREQELENMGTIFANAYVTISAATAESSHTGFLKDREIRSRAYTQPINIPCYSPTGRNDHIMLFQRGSATTREVIHNRAWTLQEDLLSPRMLFYGDFELVWVCRAGVRTISGIQAEICEEGETELARLRRIFTDSDELSTSIFDLKHGDEERMARWEDLIREYSRRKLSREDDKLPALSGLAAKFQLLVLEAEYVAGLWNCWLPTHLLWRLADDSGAGSAQSSWRAPTWSWLSMNSPVEIDVVDSRYFKVSAALINYAIQATKAFQLLGRLKSASITIRGVFNEANDEDNADIAELRDSGSGRIPTIIMDVDPVCSSHYYLEYVFLTIGYVERPQMEFPVSISRQESELSNGHARKRGKESGKFALGLVMIPDQRGTGFYNRVGWFQGMPYQKFLLSGKEKAVTIV